MRPGIRAKRKTQKSSREIKLNQRTGSRRVVCPKATAAEGIATLIILAEATTAESERHIGDGRECDGSAEYDCVRRVRWSRARGPWIARPTRRGDQSVTRDEPTSQSTIEVELSVAMFVWDEWCFAQSRPLLELRPVLDEQVGVRSTSGRGGIFFQWQGNMRKGGFPIEKKKLTVL